MSVAFSINLKSKHNGLVNPSKPNDSIGYLKGTNQCALILVHGLTGTPNEMKYLATYFNRKGYTVICPRLAHHGEPLEVLKNSKWQEFYQSLKDAFIQVKKDHARVFAAGLSMSSLLVLLLAEEFKCELSGVTCLSPTLFFDGWNTPWYQCFLPVLYMTPLKNFFYFKEDPPYGIKNQTVQKLVHKYYALARLEKEADVDKYGYPFFPVTLLYQLQLLVKHLTPRLKEIDIPVQLIQAKDDDTSSVRNSQFIYDRVNAKVKEIELLYNSYHIITADQERDKVALAMYKFYSKISKDA